jgi:predicted MFS family arabinose efflux permease
MLTPLMVNPSGAIGFELKWIGPVKESIFAPAVYAAMMLATALCGSEMRVVLGLMMAWKFAPINTPFHVTAETLFSNYMEGADE